MPTADETLPPPPALDPLIHESDKPKAQLMDDIATKATELTTLLEQPGAEAALPKKKGGRKPKEKLEKNSPEAILAEFMGGDKGGNDEAGISVIYSDSIGDEIIDSTYYISTGLDLLDIILSNGGFGTGKVSEVFGDKSSGKSELAQSIACCFLDKFKDGVVAYFDQERAIDSKKLDDRPVFKSSRFAYCWSPTAEKLFKKLEDMLERIKDSKADIPSLIIIDSVAALLTDAEADKELYEKTIASLASTLSSIFKKINPWLPKINCHLMFLNQTRANFGGGWGPPDEDETPGGKALKFYADYRLHVKKIGKYWISETAKKADADRPPDGQLVQIETVKNKIAPPYRRVVIPLLYNDVQGEKGLSNVWAIWNLLKKRKYITSVGKGYYELKTEPKLPDIDRTRFTLQTWKDHLEGPMKPFVDKALKEWEYWAMTKTTLTEAESEDDTDESKDE